MQYVIAALLLLVSNSLFARESTALPNFLSIPGCLIQAPDGGEYRYQQLHAGVVKSRGVTHLPSITKTWRINCDAPTLLHISVQDGQASSSPAVPGKFGLGFVNGQGLLGYYELQFSRAMVDSRHVNFTQRAEVLETPTISVISDRYYSLGNQQIGSLFSLDITVSPTLNSIKEMKGPLFDGADLQGVSLLILSFSL